MTVPKTAYEIAMERAREIEKEKAVVAPRAGERMLWCSTCGHTTMAEANILTKYCPNCQRPMRVKPLTFTR